MNKTKMEYLSWLVILCLLKTCSAIQGWVEQPEYQEVNPQGSFVLPCVISEKRGQCRWEKDGAPVGLQDSKYEWAGNPDTGDCSLRVLAAELQYDDGVWQCQVTPSSFQNKDALTSEGAQIVIREPPTEIHIQRIGDEGAEVIASAGEELELECIVSGGNPPAQIHWFAHNKEILSGHTQENSRISPEARTWISVSRLTLPVSKSDNGAIIKCLAEHPTLEASLAAQTAITIHYPPSVSIETSSLSNLEDEKDPATLRCTADSNPPATVLWRKEGLNGIFSPDDEINFSPVTRHTADSPSILSVGPSHIVAAQKNKQAVLSCEAEGNPAPRYQWLQKLPTQEVFIRGSQKTLVIDNVTYNHQGEFVCKAMNTINGEERSVQSEPIRVEVSGAPQVMKYEAQHEVRVQNGEDATLEVLFCADPPPKQAWHLGDLGSGSGSNIILAAGTGHGRFIAESARKSDREDCYISVLRINGAHPTDSHTYQLKLSNNHGNDSHIIHLIVRDHVSQESLIAVIVGATLTILLFLLICIYCCKSGKNACCRSSDNSTTKKDFKPTDIESERTDVESTHSSNLSGFPEKSSVIPPDALYSSSNEKLNPHKQYIHDSLFNDSKESLRADMMNITNLNRTQSSSGDLNTSNATHPGRISYNDLCFPKTSNYGSMKKKKHHYNATTQHVGVDCRLNPPNATLYYN
ncbi:hypothetical protein TCAL_06514 [Tigriopus californicus]|uniref:Ig-like domain-containing protein n=1 Tax=Tigriopus californicus TaxID=6832 RepID=A0A553P4F1_TIGCA|nr:hypothetical protein TCAL_06514 [Tigriopus californicus]